MHINQSLYNMYFPNKQMIFRQYHPFMSNGFPSYNPPCIEHVQCFPMHSFVFPIKISIYVNDFSVETSIFSWFSHSSTKKMHFFPYSPIFSCWLFPYFQLKFDALRLQRLSCGAPGAVAAPSGQRLWRRTIYDVANTKWWDQWVNDGIV